MNDPGKATRIPLLEWLPGETFYSLCSRQHRFSGFPTSSHTTQVLFGHPHAGSQHDFPSRLHAYTRAVDGVHGDADNIARTRTLLRFYAPFLPRSTVDEAVAAMKGATVAGLKPRLGVLTRQFGADHPLKACPSCIDHDIESFGWASWHLEHQYPGVWACCYHLTSLLTACIKSNGQERFSWQLPSVANMRPALPDDSDATLGAHIELSEFVTSCVNMAQPHGTLSLARIQGANSTVLECWSSLDEAAEEYAGYCKALRCVPELAALPANADEATEELRQACEPQVAAPHPTRLLTASSWLFNGTQEFQAAVTVAADRLAHGQANRHQRS